MTDSADELPPAEALLKHLAQDPVVTEAEAAVHGILYLTVVTGHPESSDEAERVKTLCDTAWAGRKGARTQAIAGGGDYRTIRIAGAAAAEFLEELATLAAKLNPGWWQIRRSAQ